MTTAASLSTGLNLALVSGIFQFLATMFENYLKMRQFQKLKRNEDISDELTDLNLTFKAETLEKTRKYNLEKTGYNIIFSYYMLFTTIGKIHIQSG